MFWKNALKYPALIAGIIMFSLFLADPKTKDWWERVQGRFKPSTCGAIMDRLEEKMPDEWSLKCPKVSHMQLEVEFEEDFKNFENLRMAAYRKMANDLKSLALMANAETLQNLGTFEILVVHDLIEVWGVTDGQALVQLRDKSTQNEMAEHLELTVKVKEKRK